MKMIMLFPPSKHLWYCTIPAHVTIWMTQQMWEEVKDVRTGILASADISSVSSNPGLLSLSRYLFYVKLRWLMAQIYIDEEFSIFVCFFFTFFGRVVLSEVIVFHLCKLVWLLLYTHMCTYACGAQRSVSCVFPSHPLLYLWRQGPLLNL